MLAIFSGHSSILRQANSQRNAPVVSGGQKSSAHERSDTDRKGAEPYAYRSSDARASIARQCYSIGCICRPDLLANRMGASKWADEIALVGQLISVMVAEDLTPDIYRA